MPSTYIPRPDAGVRDWSRNFAALISAAPHRYGLTPDDAAEIQALADEFAARLTTALEPSTRTTVAVAAKNRSRATMLYVLRGHAQAIRVRPGVADADKLALGLAPTRSPRTPTAALTTAPRLQVIVPPSGVHTLRFTDECTPTRRSKPRGVIGLQLFISTSPTPPPGPETATFRRFLSRQNTLVYHGSAARGRPAYYYARWQTRRGKVGPWSVVTTATVVA